MAMLVFSVEEGSFSAAARKLRIPVATLTRNVNDLETLVGTKLLTRSTRKLELTDAGTDYFASAKQILEQVDEQERRAAGEFSAPRGELVITTPVQIARLRVLPIIDQFLALYPEIRIRLIQSDRNVDLIDSTRTSPSEWDVYATAVGRSARWKLACSGGRQRGTASQAWRARDA